MSLPLRGTRVLVSGAGVAGPAAAWWLARHGAEVTVVEAAPALRTGGFAVDFRGRTHLGVLDAMGVLDALRAVRTHAGATSRVDAAGREIFRLPTEFAGGELEVRRRDLSRILYERGADRVEYRFGDRITALTETTDGVRATFARGDERVVDLVVGADGMHSGVRRLALGPESAYLTHLGHHLAGWDVPNDLGADAVCRQYNVPGRMASVVADPREPGRATALVVFTGPRQDHDRLDVARQKALVTDAFAGLGWHVPRLLAGLRAAPELYLDAIARVRVPRWHAGRSVLLGDAAWGVTLGGMGVGTAVVGAYVLAGELALAGGDHRVALPAYERRMRGYASRWQRGASPGQFLAPASGWGLWLRDRLLAARPVQSMLIRGVGSLATEADLPDYAAAV
ncbi:FAD-dependent monooxygenase [Micromonospora auratinigra]|uniref:2-polyprenyl-6-methoxyphenol hydroxylase n=1 Tax=Micromonospora auratinigra TaxID=261654 RepID=A0A1A8ZLV2_9ACTN|nr:FAD-dependent monooxygenase [Micromonospora auratinigra]SBT44798.1 2-polyprenyl-6-methoxyphenol hydroxylase [Micromonospora auratinigra]